MDCCYFILCVIHAIPDECIWWLSWREYVWTSSAYYYNSMVATGSLDIIYCKLSGAYYCIFFFDCMHYYTQILLILSIMPYWNTKEVSFWDYEVHFNNIVFKICFLFWLLKNQIQYYNHQFVLNFSSNHTVIYTYHEISKSSIPYILDNHSIIITFIILNTILMYNLYILDELNERTSNLFFYIILRTISTTRHRVSNSFGFFHES